MKITKQRLREIIKEEIEEIPYDEEPTADEVTRRQVRVSSVALEKALKDFVTIRNYEDTSVDVGIPALREFVDDWITEKVVAVVAYIVLAYAMLYLATSKKRQALYFIGAIGAVSIAGKLAIAKQAFILG